MVKLLSQVIFSTVMLVLGVAALFYADEIRSLVLKIIRQRGLFFNFVNSHQTTLSMRFSGVIAILIGLSV